MSLRGLNWVVLAGFAGCIPAPVLRPRDGGAEVAAEDRAVADAPLGMDAGVDVAIDASLAIDAMDAGADAVIAPMDAVDVGVVAPTDAMDVLDPVDACLGVVTDAGACEAATAPRLLSPLSGAISGSHRPLVRWVRSNTGRPQTLRFCADRACSRVLLTRMLAADLSAEVLDADLPRGPVFWRVETTDARGATLSSATWEFFVSGRSTRSVFWYGVPDFDGDGVADLVVGAFGNASEVGRAYGYRGQSIASGTPTWTLRGGDEPTGWFGFWVQSVGDINGDGFVDLAATGLQERERRGTVRIFLGSPTGLPVTTTMVLEGTTAGENFGIPVAGIGDVNGDGYADMAVGITGAMSQRGAVEVFFGGEQGVSRSRSVRIEGSGAAGALFGGGIAGIGDMNADGFDEFVIGAPGARETDPGAAWVYRGARSPNWSTQRTLLTVPVGGQFGQQIAPLGDPEGRGILSFAVAAPSAAMAQGRVYVFSGPDPSSSELLRETILPTNRLASRFGIALAGGKDLNGDEVPDLVVGAPRDRDPSGCIGAYLAGGILSQTPPLEVCHGPEVRETFGTVLSLLGDVNQDGLADLAVASPRSQNSSVVFIFRGATPAGIQSGPTRLVNPGEIDRVYGESIAQ
jgi:hypothetical protein